MFEPKPMPQIKTDEELEEEFFEQELAKHLAPYMNEDGNINIDLLIADSVPLEIPEALNEF